MTRTLTAYTDIPVPAELWGCNLMPEGILERWIMPDGGAVSSGDPVAVVRIEDALHDLTAPASGRLRILTCSDSMVEPGTVIGQIVRRRDF